MRNASRFALLLLSMTALVVAGCASGGGGAAAPAGPTDEELVPQMVNHTHEALKAKGVATECLLLETGTHGPSVKDGKPIIRASEDEYADVLMKWVKEIATQ